VEDIYRLVWTGVRNKKLLEPVTMGGFDACALSGWGGTGKVSFACCAISTKQYDGESGLEATGSPANWRCMVREKLSRVKLLDDGVQRQTIPVLPRV
jgi:hypothetical protein